MKLYLNEYSALLACAFVNGLIFTVLFWVRAYQAERKSDMIFGFVLLASCLYITDWMLGFMGIHILWEELFFIPYDIGLIIAPLMYFYLKSQLDTTFKFSKTDCWHLAPYLVYVIYHLTIFSQGREFAKMWSDTVHFLYHLADAEKVTILISNFTYLFLAFKLYKHYRRWLPTQFSNTETISFDWYRNFLLVYALAIMVNWVYIFLGMAGFHFSYIDVWWEKFLVGIIIYYVSIKGYVQVQPKLLIFREKEEISIEEISIEKGEVKNVLPDLEAWKIKLLRVVSEEKLYLDPELSLSELASKLNAHNSLLSIVINKGFGKNFNDFINEYRVKEFQYRVQLVENQHLTLLGIAFDCGFNSKATFNRVFKKMTGKSPKEQNKSM
jgi:AraC-like DNA-binding protein